MLSVCGGPVQGTLTLGSVTLSNRSGGAFCMLTPIMYRRLQGMMGVEKQSTMWIHTLRDLGKLKGGVLCSTGATCTL